jgi:hypothetical protein
VSRVHAREERGEGREGVKSGSGQFGKCCDECVAGLEPVVSWYPHSAVPRECGPLLLQSSHLALRGKSASSRTTPLSGQLRALLSGHRLQRLAARSRSASLYGRRAGQLPGGCLAGLGSLDEMRTRRKKRVGCL